MESLIVNRLTEEGMREVKLLSDMPIEKKRMYRFVPTPALELAQVKLYATSALQLFYGEATWPARDVMDIHLPDWKKGRRLVAWKVTANERMSDAIEEARVYYLQLFMRHPQYAFTGALEKGIENGEEVDGVMLIECGWVPRGVLMLGKGKR